MTKSGIDRTEPRCSPEELLKQSEDKFRAIVDRLGEGIVLIDRTGTVIEFNAAEERITGLKRGEAVGEKIWDVQFRVLPRERRTKDNCAAIKKRYSSLFHNGTTELLNKRIDADVERPDSSRAIIQTVVYPVPMGATHIYVAISKDITDARRNEKDLEEGNRRLLIKNIALHEILIQVEEEKKRVYAKVRADIERQVLPLVNKLEVRSAGNDRKYLQLIEDNLGEITAGQGSRQAYKLNRLTQKELELCDMIKRGLSSKEIGGLMNITYRTVETHRNRIRKKLEITDPAVNLATFLKNL